MTQDITLDSEVTTNTTTTTTTKTTTTQSFSVSMSENVDGSVGVHGVFETASNTATSSCTQTLKESGNDFFGLVRESIETNAVNQRGNRDNLAKVFKELSKMAEQIGKNIGDGAQK